MEIFPWLEMNGPPQAITILRFLTTKCYFSVQFLKGFERFSIQIRKFPSCGGFLSYKNITLTMFYTNPPSKKLKKYFLRLRWAIIILFLFYACLH